MPILSRASRLGRAALAVLLSAAALPVVLGFPSGIALAGPQPVFTMYVPFEEQQISDGLFSILTSGGYSPTDVTSQITITAAADNTILYWDHWEDGYDPDIANAPAISTTETWGDADLSNGAAPGVTVAADDVINAGTVVELFNSVVLPRDPAQFFFDGRDKVAATRGFAMTRAGWDTTLGTVHAGAVATTDLSKYGTQFDIPIGENISSNQAFEYTALTVMASDDNTFVEIDRDGDGTVDETHLLDEGESAWVDGGISAGAFLESSKPAQVHLLTGDVGSLVASRWYEVFPEEVLGDEYVAAASTTLASEPVSVFVHNPSDTKTINVAVDAQGTANDTNLAIVPGGTVPYTLPAGSGAQFSSPDNTFSAISATVSLFGNGRTYDWGYSLVPTSVLTPGVVVGWAASSPSGPPDFDYSPVWVAPLADTDLLIDYDADGTVDDTIFGVSQFESVTVFDAVDADMTGARISSSNGALLSVAWGQDPNTADASDAYDLGTAVLPTTSLVTTKSSRIVVDLNSDGLVNPGDTLEYTIRSVDAGALALTNVRVLDQLPSTLTYVPNSTTVDGLPITDDTVGSTVFPVDETGVLIPLLNAGEAVEVTFLTQLVDPFPVFTQTVRNSVAVTSDQANSTATSIVPVVIPNLYIAKTSNAPGPLLPNEVFSYDIEVANIDVSAQTGIDVTDTLPAEVTWLSTSISRPIDDPAPGGSALIADDFTTVAYNNNSADWSTDWIETDPAGAGPAAGDVRIISELGDNRLRLQGADRENRRTFDGANWGEAYLTFDTRREGFDDANDWVSLQISTTAGTSWIELDRFTGPGTDAGYLSNLYDLTRYLGQPIVLRWLTSPALAAGDQFFVDDVEVAVNRRVLEVVPGAAPPNVYSGGELLTGESLVATVTVQVDPGIDPAVDFITNNSAAVSIQNTSPVTSFATDPIARASVGETVWHDLDGDGVVDPGEPRLSGVTVTLYDGGGTPIATDVTDGAGAYFFGDLDPGDFTVAVTAGVPGPMSPTFDADGGYDETTAITLGFGEDFATINFGYAIPVDLGDRVFGDIGGDGVENGNDFGLDGLTVTLTGPSFPGGTTTTTTSGTYGFSNLLPGTYTVDIDTAPLSTAAYSTTGGDSQVVVLTSGNDDLTVDFGYVLPAAIGDTVFHDLNADGDQDAGEPGFVGVDVTITGTGLPVGGLTTTTDATGFYLFSNLDAGDFTITVTEGTGDLPVGYNTSTAGGLVQTRTVLDDDILFDVDFGLFTQATIGDFVFEDVNGNGSWDSGEPGIPGVPITVTGPSSVTAIVTGPLGEYEVSVDPGAYTVVPDTTGFPAGTVNTLDGASPSVTVGSTDDIDTADFGYVFPATVGDLVFHDLNADGDQDAGEPGLDGVDLTITGGSLPPGGVTTMTGGGGAYLFSNLEPGVYTVTVDTGTVPAGYVTSTGGDSVGGILIVSGSAELDIDFGYRGAADIGDLIFHDLNADGDWDAGEPGLAGVEMTLTGPGIPPGTTDTTDANGNYLFADLAPGTYTVTVNTATVPAGYAVTAGTDSRSVTLESDTDVLTVDLGYATTATIGDFVWDDLDGDGVFDAGEPGFDGVTVTLDDGVTPITQDTVNGAYDFTGVAPGTYTVTVDAGDLPPGVVNTLGGVSQIVTVESAQDENDVDFAYYQPASIGDLVWDDLDGDGVFDVGEPGFSGVTVTLTGGNLPPGGITDITDGNGLYGFAGLAPGTYTATLTTTDLPAGAVNTVGGTSQVTTVQSGEAEGDIDFGFYQPAAIGDYVWDDLDGDGAENDGPASTVGIAGVDVTIIGPSHPGGFTVTTDANGAYSFGGLAPGDYDVTVDTGTLPAGAASTTGGFAVTGVTMTSGATISTVDFGVALPVTVGDAVFDDLDGDGVQDPGEPGLGSVDVTIVGPSYPGGLTVVTDVLGFYEFTGLLPGSYDVVVDVADVPVGYSSSSPVSVTATYESGDDVDTVDFGFVLPADLGDFVWDDLDGDGVFDVGEPGLAGVTLELSGPGVAPGTTVTTPASGAYTFGSLAPGTYSVAVTGVPAGYTNTAGGASQVTTLESGETDDSLDFGYYLGASIGDLIFDDLDGDGVFDVGEPGFDAVDVTIIGPAHPGGLTIQTVNGAYDFVGLTPGAYTVTVDTVDLPAGAVNTLGGASQVFTVVSGDDENAADFGYYVPGSIGDYVWDDLDGDGAENDGPASTVGIAGVDVTIIGPSHPGGFTVTTDANGAYSFGGLAPGDYDVTVDTGTLPAGAASTTGGFAVTGVTMTSGATISTVDFGVALPVTVGDAVFDDLDGDGVQDPGEPGLGSVDVTIVGPSYPGGLTVVTDVLGFYEFTGLLPGSYDVVVDVADVPVGYSSSSPVSVTATYESGDDVDTVDFGFVLPADLGDFVWDDLDGDGVFDVGEPGLAGVTLELSGPGVAPGTTVTTPASGAYTFGSLAPGTYSVAVTGVPAGYTNTAGGASQVTTLESGETDDSLDFGYYLGASIGDLIFDDLDGDGVFDVGEPGFDAVDVTIIGPAHPGGLTIQTVNGGYDFVGLTPGAYTVTVDTVDLPAGAVNTLGGASQVFTVVSGDDENAADFGYYVPGSIGDYVWDDLDGDGAENDGPASTVGIAGVDVTIIGPSHPGGFTVTTDANGAYSFGGLAPGDYDVTVDTGTLPAGAASTTGGFAVTGVTMTSGATISTVDFGVALPASLGDLVFNDVNGNGVFDAGDAPASNVQLTLTGPGLPPTGVTDLTDVSGVYGFTGLLPGVYTVTVNGPLPGGAFFTTGTNVQTVVLSSGESDLTADFGFAVPASIGDTLFEDLDNDGVQDAGEPGLADVDVTLTGPGLPPGGTTISTGPTGGYGFSGLAPGVYTVTVDVADPEMDPVFVSTTGGDAQTQTLSSGEVIADVDFGYTAPGVIGDLVFTDSNGDGLESGDSGLGGVTLTLTGGGLPPGGVSTTTDPAGAYSFTGVLPGVYTVTVTAGLPGGAFSTTGGVSQLVTITSGEVDDTVDFGFARPATIGDFVFDDLDGDAVVDPGEPGFGSVDVTIVGPSHPGGLTVATDPSGGYSFGGLAPGAYTITVDTADLPAGAVNTLGGVTRNVTVASNDTILTADFGYTLPATIGDLIFDDLDGDGVFDVGEPGFDAVDVTIIGPAHPGGLTIQTVNGAYDFVGLTPGAYTVTVDTVDLPAGAVNTLGGASRNVTVASGDDHNAADFGYYVPGSIGDYVWDDLDGDGAENDGPASTVGIAGVDVTIIGPSHPGGFTVTTDANGAYTLGGLAPGDYDVTVDTGTLQAGAASTTGGFAVTGVTMTAGATITTIDFGVALPAVIGDLVFNDVNGNGVQDPGDAGYTSVDVTILGPSHPGGTTITTDGAGGYGFTGLFPGSYSITIDTADLPAGALSTTGGDAQTVVVESGETNNDVDFGYAVPASIGDQLFVDNNGNGAFDAGDTGIADVDVTITGPGLGGGVTVTTGPTGTYGITVLQPGVFTVTVETGDVDFDPAWVSTTGGDAQLVPLAPGEIVDTADFGYAAPAAVGDTVFDDLDGDGVRDPGEPGIPGATVTLTGGDLGGPITTITNASGLYTFAGLTPGDYVVSTSVAGFSSTTGGDNQNVSLSSGETDDTIDFGYAAAASLGDALFHDLNGDGTQDVGEPGLAGVTVTLSGPGVPPGTTDTTDASGIYGFAGLAPGSYTATVDTAGLPTPAFATTTGGDAQTVVLASGETNNNLDFGYGAPATIGNLVWDDLDGDGVFDPGEPGFDTVTVTLDDGVAPVTQETVAGAYSFTGLAPGTYNISVDTGDLPAGSVNTFGGASQTVTVQSNEVLDTVDFGYYQAGSIGDLVFVDDNGNGTLNLGESGLDGIEVTLTGAALGAPLVTTTALGGGYSFGGLAPGTYTATLTGGVPAGAASTTGGDAQTVTIGSGENLTTVDFGIAEPVTVGDFVWHDLDDDGVQDPGEPGIAGVVLELRDLSNLTIATATTDGVGAYLFTNVAPGLYTVVVDTATTPAGYSASTAESFPITVTSGNDITNIDVGYATTGSIGDLVWDDLDGDGFADPGEPGLDGLTVTLTGGDLVVPLTTVTFGGGAYGFAGLNPGTYTATVTPPATGTSTTGGDARTVTIASEEDRLDVDFGYALAATIGDRVWHDVDADGVQDAGELGIPGVAVTLVGPSGPATTTTDGLGAYVFAGLLPGAYTVSYVPATLPVGLVSGTQFAPTTAGSVNVPIQSGEDNTTADLGFATTGAISGTIYEDDDADGVEEPGESGLFSVTVELVDGGGAVVATTTTDIDGDYAFDAVPPGDYTVRVDESTIPPGFTRTSPESIPVTVISDEAVTDVDVGYARPATIGDLVWHDLDADGVRDPGEPGLSAVTVELVDGAGTVVATTNTDGVGAYTFTGLDPAAYTVRVDLTTLPVGANTGGAFAATAGVASSVPVVVVSGETVDTIDFAFHTTAEFGDFVWHDLDADSVQDPGEPGLVVTVELLDGGSVIASTTTAADGSYGFTGVTPGTYDVRVVGEPAGDSSTTGNDPSTIVLVSDQVDNTVDFGFASLTGGSIGNEIWDDLDGDGVRDAGEPGLGGVVVELFLGGASVDSRVTTSTGSYLFTNLAPGDYEVRVDPATLPAGYAATTPGADAGNTQSTTILSGAADLDVDFGFAAPAVVGDLVWHDLDGDGVRDAGEPGLAGVVLELLDGGGAVIDTATTDASGFYALTAALAGDYTITVDPASTPVGANSGDPMTTTTATTFAVSLSSNEVRFDLDVGYVTTATIGDTIFDDLDGDGAQDPGEPGLVGVTVVLTDGGGGTTSVTTGAGGLYTFSGVTPGAYSVSVDGASLPGGAVATTSAAPVPVSVVSDDLVDDVDLGYALPASLAGMVFVDAAGDGGHTGDSGVGGVVVELLDAGGTVTATTTTFADGSYVFAGLVPGGWTVRPLAPAGYRFTVPNTGDDTLDSDVLVPAGETAAVWVASGEHVIDVDAGILTPATIGDTVWVDLDGDGVQGADEPGLGGVLVEIRNAGGALVATTTTDASGGYSFTVDPGLYTVSITTPSGYRVDLGGDLQTVSVLSGETDLDIDFGLLGAGVISGDVVYDVSGDGAIDPSDPGHTDVTVQATWDGPDGVQGTTDDVTYTVSAPGGAYVFADLPPGGYVVTVDATTLPDGLVDPTVDPDAVVDLATAVTLGGAPVVGVDFATTGTASLGDHVFRDDDEDGVLDPGEPGVGGVTVTATVTTTSGPRTFTTVTDATGYYQFTDLPAGDYVVTLDTTTIPIGLVPSILTRSTTLVINGSDDSLDLALVRRVGPVAADDEEETPQNTPVDVSVLDNDTVPAATVTVTAVTQPANGTAVINTDGTVTYTPDTGFAGTDVFTYTICDLDSLAAFGDNAATRIVFCSTATVTITTPPPDPVTPGSQSTPTSPPASSTTPSSTTPPPPAASATPSTPSATTAPLPRSGSDSRPIQTLALVFLAAGLALLIAGRRREERPTAEV